MNGMSLSFLSATELLKKLASREITSVALTQACLDQIRARDGAVKAFLSVDSEGALAKAGEVDRRREAGETLGALAGLPVAVKDVLCTKGQVTTCGSKILQKFRPPYNATVIEKLHQADAVIIGKTNMDEFAMGGSSENSAYQVTGNPWDVSRTPGGSSGGSAAAVAAGMAPLSLGSDTGGSIRQPASFCGIVGLKPTYGRVSRWGLVAFASSLDQIGPFGRSVEDAALLLEVIGGHDPRDSTSIKASTPDFRRSLHQPLTGLKIGLVREHFGPGLDAEVDRAIREAMKVYESLGAKVVDVSLPNSAYGIAVYYVIAPCEASSNLARFDGAHYGYRTPERAMLAELRKEEEGLSEGANGKVDNALVRMYRQSRAEGFGPEVKRRIMLGTYALSAGYYDAYYLKALKVRRLIRQDFDKAFEQVDLIAGPTAPTPAFKIGEKGDDPLAMYLVDLYTVSTNLAGHCGISVPCGMSKEGMPIGLQLQAPPLEEERLFRGAAMFQKATDWHTKTPRA